MEISSITTALDNIGKNNFFPVFEFDKVNSTLDFFLIIRLYLLGFCLIDNMPNLLLKFFVFSTVFSSPVLELVIGTAVTQDAI